MSRHVVRVLKHLLALVFAVSLPAASAFAAEQPAQWTLISPNVPGGPDGGRYSSSFLDRAGGRLIVQMGRPEAVWPPVAGVRSQTWTYDLRGSQGWRFLAPVAPSGTNKNVFDPIRRRLLTFGEVNGIPGTRIGSWMEFDVDTGTTWVSHPVAGALPENRHGPVQILFDETRDRVLLCGGWFETNGGHTWHEQSTVWAFSPATSTWAQLAPDEPVRVGADAAIDPANERLIEIPGAGSAWALPLDGSGPFFPLPSSVRYIERFAGGDDPVLNSSDVFFDPLRGRLLTSGLGDSVFFLDLDHGEQDWKLLPAIGSPPGGEARLVVFDPDADRAIAFGGSYTSNGIWALSFDHATPTEVSLVEASATPAGARLEWRGAEPGAVATLERATNASAWTPIAELSADGEGALAYLDPNVVPGARYGWRLALPGDPTRRGETWLEIPRAAALALAGLQPNPAPGDPVVVFTLDGNAPAWIEAFDVGGRRLVAREVGALGPGEHRVRLAELADAPAGIMLLRLRASEGRMLVRKALRLNAR